MTVVTRDELPALVQQTVRGHVAEWGRHRALQRFLRDHAPLEWDAITRCRMAYKTLESTTRPGHYKIAPSHACWRLPYCIHCTRASTARRVAKALDQLHRCTPRGKQPRFIGIVQTAPIKDGKGWGVQASEDLKGFGAVVWETIQEFYGEGLGAVMSYQDFGERAFAKRHPHWDLTLNGWRLGPDGAETTPLFDFTGRGRRRWDRQVAVRALRLAPVARRGNVHVLWREGIPAYRSLLWYKMREMVDLRKIKSYDRSSATLTWVGYASRRRPTVRQQFGVVEFLAGLAEYRSRLGQWPEEGDQGMEIHRRYGHLAKNRIRAAQDAFDGEPLPHGRDCPCSECDDWERVFLDDVDPDGWRRRLADPDAEAYVEAADSEPREAPA